jgi:nucleoside-diphosphate-sugar epimerase
MKVLVTGNMGYIGPRVGARLRASLPQVNLIGLDTGYFAHCLTGADALPERIYDQQWFADVRRVSVDTFRGVDAVVHLAAISNDPMGKTFEHVTEEINFKSSVRVARLAREAGVKRFVFASSCSMYGAADGGPRKETDALNPLTAYARSKVATEKALPDLANESFVVTSLRFATACGMSERLRLDLVLNDFVASAVASRKITILSDGTPWRPLIHVDDMARAIEWGVTRTATNGGVFIAVNAGSDAWNYQVKDLAAAVARAIPGVEVLVNPDAQPDKRSYRVDFGMFRELAPGYQPQVSLHDAIGGLKTGLERMEFRDVNFRDSRHIRLRVLAEHLQVGRLNEALEWVKDAPVARVA